MLRGVYTALVTPFNRDGSMDTGALKSLVQFQLDSGIHGLVPVGTTGESPTLDTKEKELIIQTCIDLAGGKVPVIAGTGANNTQTAVEATIRAKEMGADYSLQVTPYYNKPSEEGLYRHFTEIAEKSQLPLIIYTVPGRSAINISPSLLMRLAKHPLIIGVKEASGNISQILDILNKKPDDFCVLSGDDAITLPLMASGGHGVISVASNAFPKEIVALTEHLLNKRMEEAWKVHNYLYPIFVNQFIETNPVPIKTWMASKGMMQENFRLPLVPLKEENKKILLASLDK